MPFEFPDLTGEQRLNALNAAYKHRAAIPVLREALKDPLIGTVAMVSSFGAESVVLLHLLASIDRTTPILFVDTEMMFPETLSYQEEVSAAFGLTDVRRISATADLLQKTDPNGALHKTDTNACCDLRKTRPLQTALSGFDTWITGRKRFQSGLRQDLPLFELDKDDRIKINPLAHWKRQDLFAYIRDNDLPRHPLVAQGYPSIGCAPCTQRPTNPNDARSGRWVGSEKTECGIHFDTPSIDNK
jgi:phosphoadenosine phosphosulfate reductase